MNIRSPAADDILRLLPGNGIRSAVEAFMRRDINVDEFRLRSQRPLAYTQGIKSYYITPSGDTVRSSDGAYIVTSEEVNNVFRAVCDNSVYAYLDDIRRGFVTVRGGHRIGFCGRAVCSLDGRIETFRDINSINIRVAREVMGCADDIIGDILADGVCSTLIISPPGCGKTTLLRDIVRQVSDSGFKVGVADDRSEISAMYHGTAQNDIGANTDVIENSDKADAVEILQRTMSPSVIVTDEIVTASEVSAVCRASGTGIAIIASVHGSGFDEVLQKPQLKPLFEERVFSRLVLIKGRDSSGLITDVLLLDRRDNKL